MELIDVKFLKLRENAVLPYKTHLWDAGFDISWAPIDNSASITILPGESIVLETGLKAMFSNGYVLEVKNRSGMASKKSLVVGACIVDSTYRGEIFVNLHNIGLKEQKINAGDKIAQILFYKVENPMIKEIKLEEYDKYTTTRGSGGFGSTGT